MRNRRHNPVKRPIGSVIMLLSLGALLALIMAGGAVGLAAMVAVVAAASTGAVLLKSGAQDQQILGIMILITTLGSLIGALG